MILYKVSSKNYTNIICGQLAFIPRKPYLPLTVPCSFWCYFALAQFQCGPAGNLNGFFFFQVSLLEESGAFDKALEELHKKESKIVTFLKLIVMIYLGHRIQAYSGFTFLLWLYVG